MLSYNGLYMPHEARVIELKQEHHDVITLRLKFCDLDKANSYSFQPGQFNMLYLYGIGEVAMSIVNNCNFIANGCFEHTIQIVGKVTKGLAKLRVGDKVGIRGPFGSHWPLDKAQGKDIIIVSGGLGNAPLVAATEEILHNRDLYGNLYILHGIRSSDLLIFEAMYERWHNSPKTQVMMATSNQDPIDNGKWQWRRGFVTNFIPNLEIDFSNTILMTVGPEIMMKLVAKEFIKAGLNADNIYVSLERNMKCAIGFCGHCQLGPEFICKNGPVYAYSKCNHLLEIKGL